MSLELKNVNFTYNPGTPMQQDVLKDINVTIEKGEFLAIMGHTGSGKSTLIQHMNALVSPTSGQVLFDGQDIFAQGFDKRMLRSKVGMVFQYPEHQLFEETVFEDICFGPRNLKLSEEEVKARAEEAMKLTGVPDDFRDRSPFELSGGQKRRVAIAGVLAMKPEYLILDEPTAGLDPGGRDEILDLLKELHEKSGISIILVSHSMEDIANYAQRILVLNDGRIVLSGTPREVFQHADELAGYGLSVPQAALIMHALKEKGFDVDTDANTVAEAKAAILAALARRGVTAGKAGEADA